MNIIEAIILGIIQGATEFLPISSSGHLLLIPSLFHLEEPDLNKYRHRPPGNIIGDTYLFQK